ncbi:unnamed protein product [Arabis nemorensis]|uniref:AAA-type ATPase N-terminal domain-containing protein n=1 Tax=Arabis nemorensis TaxID=586526 RepID=A0A565CWU3_9BRAS|nr:unnamed protein product [Arabis nemorensis]
MVFSRDLPSPASIFSTYSSMMGIFMMLRPMVHTSLVGSRSSILMLIINQRDGTQKNGYMMQNELYSAAQIYLSSKISPDASNLRITRYPNNKKVNLYICQGEVVSDTYQGAELKWRHLDGIKQIPAADDGGQYQENFNWECFELSFDKKHRDLVLNSYVPYVEKEARQI